MQEALDDRRVRGGMRRAPEAATSPQRQQRLADLHIFHQERRKFLGTRPCAKYGLLAVSSECDVVVLPGGEPALPVDRCPQPMKPTGPVIVMHHVIFARPHELHRPVETARDDRGLTHVISHQPPAETTPYPRLVYADFFVPHAE